MTSWQSCAACSASGAWDIPARSTRWRPAFWSCLPAARRARCPFPKTTPSAMRHTCALVSRPTRRTRPARCSAARSVRSAAQSSRRCCRSFAVTSCRCRRCIRRSRLTAKSSMRSPAAAARSRARRARSRSRSSPCSARRTGTMLCASAARRAPISARSATISARRSAAAA